VLGTAWHVRERQRTPRFVRSVGERTGTDWQAVERSSEFRELVRRRKAFLVPITVFWVAFFLTYLLLAAFAPGLMGERVLGVSLGFVLSVAQVLMTWLVTFLYIRRADRVFEPLERRAAEVATRTRAAS
jgi:uncharacterized membrane protein (DUF485 family)